MTESPCGWKHHKLDPLFPALLGAFLGSSIRSFTNVIGYYWEPILARFFPNMKTTLLHEWIGFFFMVTPVAIIYLLWYLECLRKRNRGNA